jgi:hypothetical protein
MDPRPLPPWPTTLLRGLVLALSALALTGLSLPSGAPRLPPVPLVDVSASLGAGGGGPPPAGLDAWIAFAGGVADVDGPGPPPPLDPEGTWLAGALRRAAERFAGRDVRVYTDGRGTDGDPAFAARAVAAGGGRVHASPPRRPPADVGLVEARVVDLGRGGREVLARVASSTAGTARLRLSAAGRTVAESVLRVEPGVVMEAPPLPLGPAAASSPALHLRLEPGPGTPNDDPANDALELGAPEDRPSVLVWGDVDARGWAGPGSDLSVRVVSAWEDGAVAAADCVVLAGIPWRDLGPQRTARLEAFVAGGGRLLVLGGPDAFAGGGWTATALETRLLPLRSPRSEGQTRAVVLAIDRSGSTSAGALAHLVAAAQGLARALVPGESLAVLPFTARPAERLLAPGWVRAEEPEGVAALLRSLEELEGGGGTDLVAGTLGALAAVSSRRAGLRQVLLLTDGDPDRAPDPEALRDVRQGLDEAGVAFGAVVSGMPETAAVLRDRLASRSEDVVLLERADAIPASLLAAWSDVRSQAERRARPSVAWAEGTQGLPSEALSWVHAVEPVAEAPVRVEAVARFADGPPQPFAAARVVGAGEVVALAWGPGCEPAEARALASAWLRPLVVRLAAASDRGLAAEEIGGDLVLSLNEAEGAGAVTVVAEAAHATLVERAPGLFRGPTPGAAGAALGSLRVRIPGRGGAPAVERPLRLPVRPPPEHRGAGVDEEALAALARAGGGLRLAPEEPPPPGPAGAGLPLAPLLLVLAVGALLLERWRSGAAPGFGRSSSS